MSNIWQMRKGFLHDRLGFGGRSCGDRDAKWALTSGESLARAAGWFAGTGVDSSGDRSGRAIRQDREPRRRGVPGRWRTDGGRGGGPTAGGVAARWRAGSRTDGGRDRGVQGATLWREGRLSPMLGQSPTAGAKGHGGGGRHLAPIV